MREASNWLRAVRPEAPALIPSLRAGWHPPRISWASAGAATIVLLVAAFFVAPWSLQGKSLALLHGLCAQQPTHSLYFGQTRLPFDARMTGIYGGFACSVAWFGARGRWRYGGVPPVGIVVALLIGVVALAADGFNSFLLDARQPHLYTPHNALRLTTGLLTGTTLAVFIWMLVMQTGFAATARVRRPALASGRELGGLLTVEALFGALVLTRWAPLCAPLTLLMIGSAIVVLSGLTLAFVLLLTRRDCTAASARQLAGPATAAVLLALGLLCLTAGSRFLLEAALHVPAPS